MKFDPLPSGDPAKAHKTRRIGVGGCLAIIGGLFGLLMILLVVGYLIFARAAERRITEHLAELRAAGHPTTTTELEDRYTMSFILLPAIDAMIAAGARTEASQDVVDAMIAAERFQRDTGEPPRNLESLVPDYLPAVPNDPFDGQPLRYVLEDDEVVVYSIGRDNIDNGGQGDLYGEPDISVRLPK